MKTNRIMDEIRSTISPEMKLQMEMSVSIANRIYEILEAKGMTQKDLAKRLGKTETEVSRWLSGTHNLTLSTICKISAALGDPILQVVHQVESSPDPVATTSGQKSANVCQPPKNALPLPTQTSNNACHCKTRSLTIKIIRL